MTDNLAKNLKKLLTIHGVAPSQVAEKCGVGKPILSRILSGETYNPQVETLKPIAEFFKVTIDQLIGMAPLPNEYTHGIVVPIERLLIPLIGWENVSYWQEIKDNFKPNSTIAVDSDISPNSFALIIKNNIFEPRIANGTTIVVDPMAEPKNRDYVIIEELGKTKSDTYSGLTIKQFIIDEGKKFLKNVGGSFDMIPLKRQKIFGVIIEAFMKMQSEI